MIEMEELERSTQAIAKAPHLGNAEVSVEVLNHSDNLIILRGRVRSYHQKQMAQEAVRAVMSEGFKIKNRIVVQG